MADINPELRRYQVAHDLPYLHRERWNRIAAEITERIESSQGDERAKARAELDEYYRTRFDSESSRAVLLAEAGLTPDQAQDRKVKPRSCSR